MAYLESSTGGDQGRIQAERTVGTGAHAKARFLNSKQKSVEAPP